MSLTALIPLILSSLSTTIDLYAKIREILQQTGEWTPAQEAEFNAIIEKAKVAPHWQTLQQTPEETKVS